jgi:hypothetical protein
LLIRIDERFPDAFGSILRGESQGTGQMTFAQAILTGKKRQGLTATQFNRLDEQRHTV